MDERVYQWRVGVVVLATLIITAILVVLFGGVSLTGVGAYTVYVSLPDAPGISQDSPVRKSGKLIGRVHSIDFAEDQTILITARINGDVKLYKTEVCRISSTLLGNADLEFVRGQARPRPEDLVHDGDVIAGEVQKDPLEVVANLEGNLSDAISSVATTSDQVGRLAKEIADLVDNNQEQVGRIVAKAETTLESIGSAVGRVDSFLNDPELQGKVKSSLEQFPQIVEDTREAINSVRNTIETAERNLQNLEGLTRPLGENGEEIVNRVNQTLGRVDKLFASLTEFTEALDTSEGTLGKLLNDPQLYQNLDRAAENLAELTERARPILEDVRVISDKLARDPGSEIGLRSIFVPRRSGIK